MDPKTVDHDHVEPGGVAGKLTGESFKAQGRGRALAFRTLDMSRVGGTSSNPLNFMVWI